MQYQTSLFRGQPDTEAVKLVQYYEGLALESDPRGYCVCTSEGKDSRVLGAIMRQAGVKHFYQNNITGIDPPELVYFRRKNFQKYEDMGYLTKALPYAMSFWRLCRKKRMLPLRTHRFCCEVLKEGKSEWQGNAILSMGVRKNESVGRAQNRNELEIVANGRRGKNIIMPWDNDENRRQFEVCYANFERRVNPIAYWTSEDVWNYSKDIGLEQCSLYDEGFDRLGCIGCPMARYAGRRREFDRWKGFEASYKRTIQHLIDDRIAEGKPFIKSEFKNVETYFDWWMSDKIQDLPSDEQMQLEEYE